MSRRRFDVVEALLDVVEALAQIRSQLRLDVREHDVSHGEELSCLGVKRACHVLRLAFERDDETPQGVLGPPAAGDLGQQGLGGGGALRRQALHTHLHLAGHLVDDGAESGYFVGRTQLRSGARTSPRFSGFVVSRPLSSGFGADRGRVARDRGRLHTVSP